MTAPLPLMTEDEVRRCAVGVQGSTEEEVGFGCLRSERGPLPLKELDVDARVIATFAHTTVRQVFVNTLGVPLEATYIFPLPDRAAVTRFTMEVAGRRVDGVLEERLQARRTYDAAIAQGKRASIAEEERPGVFTLRVGNLMPGEAATITLELSGALPVADGEVTYRFPLVVAPRYMPGQLLGGDNVGDGIADDTSAVPDASRISPPVLLPGFRNPVRLGISVELDAAGLPLSQVRSSLHAAYADDRGGRLLVRLPAGERLNRDFILRFRLGDDAVRTSARLLADALAGPQVTHEQTLALTILPPAMAAGHKPKDVVFVLDRSGSMQGWKMVAARRATARMIDALRAQDRFQVLAFDNRFDALPASSGDGSELSERAELIEASDRNRFRAAEWLAKVEARGGTEMAGPLARAADLLGGGYLERDRVLVFVTDGQVGNEAQLMKLLGDKLRGARVFALGIDQAVNAGFLNRLAALGRGGDAELVETEDRLDEVLTRLHRRVDAPVIAELSLDVEGGSLVSGTVAPSRLPDVFAGVPTAIFARAVGSVRSVIVRGRLADGRPFEERVPAVAVHNPAVRAAWARLHLRDLEDRFDAGQGDKRELERRILDVSLRHTVLCRFTAFVAVDHEVVNRGGRQHQAVQPVEQPAGWEMTQASMPPAPAARAPAAPAMSKEAKRAAPARTRAAAPPADSLFADDEALEMAKAEAMAPPSPMPAGAPLHAEPPGRALGAAPPAQAPRKAGSVLGAVLDAVSEVANALSEVASGLAEGAKTEETAKARKPQAGSGGTGLGAFRPVLVALVELARRRAADLLGVARELEQRLRLLLEDLAHAGVAAGERQPLGEALQALSLSLATGDALAVETACARVEELLDRAAGGVPKTPEAPAAAGRGEGFWR